MGSRFNLREAMKTIERADDAVDAKDELMELQLRIARRADELARSRRGQETTDWECWSEAEHEVLSEAGGAGMPSSR